MMPKRAIRMEAEIAIIPLTQGYEAIIDAEDVALLGGHNWNARVKRRPDGSVKAVYAVRMERLGPGKQKVVVMHRVIAGTPAGLDTDHIDGDGLNNRRSNLRAATRTENNRNLGRGRNNTSGFRGVTWETRLKKWEARIILDGKKYRLGYFVEIERAAEAYAKASIKMFGQFSRAQLEMNR